MHMGNLASAIHPQEMDAAIRRMKTLLRLLEPEPCAQPKAHKERKWPIPEPVQVAMLKAMHPEMAEARVRKLLREGRMCLPGKKYDIPGVERAAIISFVAYVGKKPVEIGDDDFSRNGLGWLANRHGSSFGALKSVGLLSEKERHAHRFRKKPETFGNREKRIDKLREAQKKLGGEPRERRTRDFKEPFPKVYNMVINYYHGSAFEAYFDAGLVTKRDEEYMRANNKPGK